MTLPGGQDLQRCVVSTPEDFVLSVRVLDHWQSELPASYLVTVRESGPLLVHYKAADQTWCHRCEVSGDAVMEVWRSVSACRLVEDGALSLSDGELSGRWLSVSAWGRSRWVPLDESGEVRGWPVVAELERLVSAEVWRHVKRRRRLLLAELGVSA